MFNQPKNPIIIDDLVFLNVDLSTLRAKSAAKDSKYYKAFLGDTSDSKIVKEAEKFECFNEIYTYMYNRGYLNGHTYNIMFNYCSMPEQIIDNKQLIYAFTLNLSELCKQVDLKQELESHFDRAIYGKYISRLFNPPRSCKCACCGAYSLSVNYISEHDTDFAKAGRTICPNCYDLVNNSAEGYTVAFERKHNGVIKANELKRELCLKDANYDDEFELPRGIGVLELLSSFKQMHAIADGKLSRKLKAIEGLMQKQNLSDWDIFETDKFGIVAWNRKKLLVYSNLFESCSIDKDTKQIVDLYDRFGVVYTGSSINQLVEDLIDQKYIDELNDYDFSDIFA